MQNRKTNQKAGFTLVEIMIVVAIIGLLAAIAIPNFIKSREIAQLNTVFNNLRIIEGAKDSWALENKKGTGDSTDMAVISNYLKGGTVKPAVSETYTSNDIGSPAFATCPTKLGTYAANDAISVQ